MVIFCIEVGLQGPSIVLWYVGAAEEKLFEESFLFDRPPSLMDPIDATDDDE